MFYWTADPSHCSNGHGYPFFMAEGCGDCANTLLLQVFIGLTQHKLLCWNSYCLSLVLPLSFLCSLERIPIPKTEIKKQRPGKAEFWKSRDLEKQRRGEAEIRRSRDLEKQSFGKAEFWKSRVLEKQRSGVAEFWSSRVLEEQRSGKAEFWRSRILEKQRSGESVIKAAGWTLYFINIFFPIYSLLKKIKVEVTPSTILELPFLPLSPIPGESPLPLVRSKAGSVPNGQVLGHKTP